MASGGSDQNAIIWDASTGKILQTLANQSTVQTVVFSPDSRKLATVTDSGVLRLWDVSTGQELQRLTGLSGGSAFVQFSPDGQYLLTSDRNNVVSVWNLQLGEAVRQFHLPPVSPLGSAVTYSPDGQSILMSDENRIVHRIDLMLEPGRLLQWVYANRYVRELTCDERQIYRLTPNCDGTGQN